MAKTAKPGQVQNGSSRQIRNKKGKQANIKAGPKVEDVTEEPYDADVEVVGPDEYEDADSDEEEQESPISTSSTSTGEDAWQKDVLKRLRTLDCDSGSATESSRPTTGKSSRKRKAQDLDGTSSFRSKHLRHRSSSPMIEVEEVVSGGDTRRNFGSLRRKRNSPGKMSLASPERNYTSETPIDTSSKAEAGAQMDLD